MFVAKPQPFGAKVNLNGSDKDVDVQDLSVSGVALLQTQDYGQWGNPDGAAGNLMSPPSVMQVQGNSAASHSSGAGALQKTAQNTAPKSNPFPAPSSSVRTSPSSIKN